MASPTIAARATLLMRQCRHRHLFPQHRHSSSSPYAPSNFTHPPPSTQHNPSTSLPVASLPPYAHPRSRGPPPTEIPGTRLTPKTWFLSLFGHTPKSTYIPSPIHPLKNPYRARKSWPPDFRALDAKQQFHFEKTYRRRMALKWARPRWNRNVKLVQQTLLVTTIIYFVFICEPGYGTPFDGFRVWFFDKVGMLGQLPDETRVEAEKLREEARGKGVKDIDADTSPTAS